MGAGIILYFSLENEPRIGQTGSLVSLVLLGSYLCIHRFRKLFYIFIALFVMASGFMLAHFRTYMVEAPVLSEEVGPIWVRGVIESMEKRVSDHRIILRDVSLWKYPKANTPAKIRLNVRTPLNGAKIGDFISIKAKLMPPPGPVMPGSYDFSRWAFFEGIGAVGFPVVGVEIKETSEQRGTKFNNIVSNLRKDVGDKIFAALGSDDGKTTAGIAAALLTGEKGSIDKKALESMRSSGLGHLLAISGLHMVLITATIYFFVRAMLALIPRVALSANIKKWAASAALIFGLFYLLLSGAPVSAQRAYIMTGLFFLAILVDRTGWPMRPVIWAAMIILIITPEVILGPSFQMSFAAAIALIAAYQSTVLFGSETFKNRTISKRMTVYFLSLMFSSFIAGMATAPFGIYHFGHFSQYGILANAVAIPLTSVVVMPMGLLALILMPIGLEALPFYVMGMGIDTIVEWSKYINALPASSIKIPAISSVALALITLGGLWLCFWRMKVRLLGVPLIVIGLVWSFVDIEFPDVVVDKKGKLFALRSASGEYVFSDRMYARYSRDIWARMLGQSGKFTTLGDIKKSKYLKELLEGDGVFINCFENECEYYKDGKKLYITWGEGEWQKNCDEFDLVVSLRAENIPCKKDDNEFVSLEELTTEGTHLFKFLPEKIDIRTVREERGSRPWSDRR